MLKVLNQVFFVLARPSLPHTFCFIASNNHAGEVNNAGFLGAGRRVLLIGLVMTVVVVMCGCVSPLLGKVSVSLLVMIVVMAVMGMSVGGGHGVRCCVVGMQETCTRHKQKRS